MIALRRSAAAALLLWTCFCDVTSAQPTPDLNLSGTTDLLDVQVFLIDFGLTGEPLRLRGDLNVDGLVDICDFVLFRPHITGPGEDPCDPTLCYDQDPSTLDVCASGDCQNIPIPECCSHAVQCMDGDACTQDICLAFRCINPPLECMPRDCDDGIACTLDACVCGACTHLPSSSVCDDGIFCTHDECLEGLGCIHAPDDSLCPNQDDSDANCVRESCDPALGCIEVDEPSGSPCCGNGVLDPGEECDGADLGGSTCESFGFGSGMLACTITCDFDTSECQRSALQGLWSMTVMPVDFHAFEGALFCACVLSNEIVEGVGGTPNYCESSFHEVESVAGTVLPAGREGLLDDQVRFESREVVHPGSTVPSNTFDFTFGGVVTVVPGPSQLGRMEGHVDYAICEGTSRCFTGQDVPATVSVLPYPPTIVPPDCAVQP